MHILITGDTYLGGGRVKQLAESGDVETLFGALKTEINASDLVITNLESPIIDGGTAIAKTGPAIKASVQSLKILGDAGFNLVTLANNHIMDFGNEGLASTLEECNKAGLNYVGAGENADAARMPFYYSKDGLTVAIINIAENEFGTTHGDYPGGHALNPVDNYYTIKEAKEKADKVIVIVHGGHELYAYPSPRMKKTYRYLVDAGADAVVGHHTHWFSGYEVYNGSPIFYSLGNFIFDNQKETVSNWNKGFAVRLSVKRENIDFEIIPYLQNTQVAGISNLSPEQKQEFETEIAHINDVIEDDVLLSKEFDKYIAKTKKMYWAYLEPHSSRLVRGLQRKSILPSILSKYKRRLLLNLIRCEAHRDVVVKNLENDYSKQLRSR